jgi:hypothetical protein
MSKTSDAVQLGYIIHYVRNDKPHSAPVLTRMTVENLHDDWNSTKEQRATFQPAGPSRIVYFTVHGMVQEDEITKVEESL